MYFEIKVSDHSRDSSSGDGFHASVQYQRDNERGSAGVLEWSLWERLWELVQFPAGCFQWRCLVVNVIYLSNTSNAISIITPQDSLGDLFFLDHHDADDPQSRMIISKVSGLQQPRNLRRPILSSQQPPLTSLRSASRFSICRISTPSQSRGTSASDLAKSNHGLLRPSCQQRLAGRDRLQHFPQR